MTAKARPWSAPQMIFSALAAIALWSALGFSWFGTGFNWHSQGSAQRMSARAVVENQAEICAAQARGAADSDSALAELRALTDWKRGEFVTDAGWATMPGNDTPKGGVASLCAEMLVTG